MPTVAEVVRRYGAAYLERFGATMPAAHKKVLRAIAACRTGELGTVLYRCEYCGQMHAMGRSCGDRHCPSCQRDKAEAWLAEADRSPAAVPLLPGHLHAAGGAARSGAGPSAGGLRGAVRGLQRGAAPAGGGPEVHRHGSDWASSACCTPGAGRWSITRTSTTWSPAAASAPTAIAGCRRGPTSSCR